ncbi:hypothetical protein R3P38DRAFT_3279468 [Favolaschia claudopus]|uniref:Uncharacterized protein n=1 Tax=Favolaschia claudopus TaxID=2862362 RepID=A0AAW0AJG4_9AGAR
MVRIRVASVLSGFLAISDSKDHHISASIELNLIVILFDLPGSTGLFGICCALLPVAQCSTVRATGQKVNPLVYKGDCVCWKAEQVDDTFCTTKSFYRRS